MKYVHELCAERKMCVIWATHLIDEAEQAEQVLVLNKGKLLQRGNAQELCALTKTESLLDAFLQLSGEQLTPPVAPQL